jgi:hypothetical protein
MSDWEPQPQADEDDLEKAKEAVAGDVPMMSQPPDGSVALFRGLWQQGIWRTEAKVRELTGDDEEAVARAMNADDTLGFVNAMLQQGVQEVGMLDLTTLPGPERMGVINQLLVGEKEWLFLRILQTTFGDERTVVTTCPTCKAEMDVTFQISEDIQIKALEDPQKATYDFKLRDGTMLEYRLVTGEDQSESTKRRGAVIPEQNTVLLSRCIVTVNGKTVVDPLHYARSLGAGDRRKLLADINDHQPGPYFQEVKLPCAECGVEATFLPGWADLL